MINCSPTTNPFRSNRDYVVNVYLETVGILSLHSLHACSFSKILALFSKFTRFILLIAERMLPCTVLGLLCLFSIDIISVRAA